MTHDDDVTEAIEVTQEQPVPLIVAQMAIYRHGRGRVLVLSVPEVGFIQREYINGPKWLAVRSQLPPEVRKLVD